LTNFSGFHGPDDFQNHFHFGFLNLDFESLHSDFELFGGLTTTEPPTFLSCKILKQLSLLNGILKYCLAPLCLSGVATKRRGVTQDN